MLADSSVGVLARRGRSSAIRRNCSTVACRAAGRTDMVVLPSTESHQVRAHSPRLASCGGATTPVSGHRVLQALSEATCKARSGLKHAVASTIGLTIEAACLSLHHVFLSGFAAPAIAASCLRTSSEGCIDALSRPPSRYPCWIGGYRIRMHVVSVQLADASQTQREDDCRERGYLSKDIQSPQHISRILMAVPHISIASLRALASARFAQHPIARNQT